MKKAEILHNILKGSAHGVLLASLTVCMAQAATLEEVLAKANQVEADISKTTVRQKEISQKMSDIETKYQKELSLAEPDGVASYDSKIAAAKAKKQKDKEAKVETEEKSVEKAKPTQTKEETTKKKTISYPLERNPRYVAPKSKSNSRGRRPFTRSDNEYGQGELYFASRQNSEELSFAKEATAQAYTGTTEENVFVFSDNLANYCQIDTKSLDKMSECLSKLIKERSGTSQSMQEQVNELYQESLIDTTSHAVADAARFKNDTSGYEKNVLLPLQEKSSKATDERGDIEVLTLTEMEALKLKNKLIQVYSNQLGLNAFKDFGTFEVNNRDLTNIDETTEK